jgi:hypothetical protein
VYIYINAQGPICECSTVSHLHSRLHLLNFPGHQISLGLGSNPIILHLGFSGENIILITHLAVTAIGL